MSALLFKSEFTDKKKEHYIFYYILNFSLIASSLNCMLIPFVGDMRRCYLFKVSFPLNR